MRQYLNIFLAIIFSVSMIGAFGQEYDDLYFTKADRKKQKKKKIEMTNPSYGSLPEEQVSRLEDNEVETSSFLGRQFKEANPVMDVSEESLDYYAPDKTQEEYISEQTQSAYINGTERNPNFSNPQATVYDNPNNNQPVIINNYYNDSWNNWNRPGWNFGFGFNNWGGNFWSISYGNAWGNPWYDPFWDPWWGWNAWGPRWGWNAGWGWNSWAWNGWGWGAGSLWCPPYYGNYRRPVYIVDSGRRGRDVVRGSRASRGSVSSRESRSSSGRGAAVASDASINSRNYSRQQANYLNRSRSNRYNPGTRGSSAINSRSNSSSRLFNNNGRSNTNSNFTRTSNTRNRSYSPPASSRSRSSSVRSSGSSRSSGSVSRSRSSSSSRSSGSRSSSGRSSSRRGGS